MQIKEKIKTMMSKKYAVPLILLALLLFLTVSITACNAFVSPYLKELKLQNEIAALSKIETLEVRFIGDPNDPNQRNNAKYYVVTALYNDGRREELKDFDFTYDSERDIITIEASEAPLARLPFEETLKPKGDGKDNIYVDIIDEDKKPTSPEESTSSTSSVNESKNSSNPLHENSSTPSKATPSKPPVSSSGASGAVSSKPPSSAEESQSNGGNNNGGYNPSPTPPPVKVLVTEVKIITMPDKSAYLQGDFFDPKGLVVEVLFSNGTKKTLENITLTEQPKLMPSDVTVAVGYKGEHNTMYCYVPITVTPRTPTAITIISPPSKIAYIEGMKFDPTGLDVKIDFDNGDVEPVEIEGGKEPRMLLYSYLKADLLLGQTEIEIFYEENDIKVSTMQPISVTARSPVTMQVTTLPDKTDYIEDTKFDKTGMVVEVLFDNGKSEIIDGYTYSDNDLTVGTTFISLSYKENGITVTTMQPIMVKAKTPVSLHVKTPPAKTAYIEENIFDPSGMVVEALYDNEKRYEVTGYTHITRELTTADVGVTIYYIENGESVDTVQPITVAKRTPTKLNIITPPTKTTYIEDLPFDKTGLTMSVEYDNGKTHATMLFDYASEMLALGQSKIELSYTENGTTVTAEQPITVTKKVLQSISVREPPTKTFYIEDTKFDKSGMVVEGLYNNGKSYPVTSYSFDKSDLIKGATSIELSYSEDSITKTAVQPITVKAKTPTSLLIKTPPSKTAYVEQTRFDKSGMVVNALCDNGKEYPVTAYSFNTDELPFGTNKIELSYTENGATVTAIQQIAVVKKTPTKLNIVTQPTKTTYIEDTKFDKSGLTLSVEYDNGKTFPVADFDFEDIDLVYGNTSKQVSYTENGATVRVNVPVTVVKKTPVSISVKTPPTKVKYVEETIFDKTGMVIEGLYDNGKIYPVASYTCTSSELPMGTTEVTITLVENGATKTTKQAITVIKKSPVELHLIGTPVRQIEGMPFNATGLSFEATYDNGKRLPVDTSKVSWNKNKLTKGIANFEFIYTENSTSAGCTLQITVTQKLPIALHIVKQPDKTIYSAGQKFKNAGMIVEAEYDNGSRQVVTSYVWDDVQLYEGQTSVEIRYSEEITPVSTKFILPQNVAPLLAVYMQQNFKLLNCTSCNGSGKLQTKISCYTCAGKGTTGYRGVCTVHYCEDGIINLVACSDGCYQSIGTESWQTCIYETGTQKTWQEVCDKCNGDSWIDTLATCKTCKGEKMLPKVVRCLDCSGTGIHGHKLGSKIKEVKAVDGTLPEYGRGSDGYWYTRLGSYDEVMKNRPKPKPFVKMLKLKHFSKLKFSGGLKLWLN